MTTKGHLNQQADKMFRQFATPSKPETAKKTVSDCRSATKMSTNIDNEIVDPKGNQSKVLASIFSIISRLQLRLKNDHIWFL